MRGGSALPPVRSSGHGAATHMAPVRLPCGLLNNIKRLGVRNELVKVSEPGGHARPSDKYLVCLLTDCAFSNRLLNVA